MTATKKAILGLVLLVLFEGNVWASGAWFEFSGESMTTKLSMEFEAPSEAQAIEVRDAVFRLFDEIENSMSSYIESSEISRLNSAKAEEWISVSGHTFRVVEKAQELAEISRGAFDITYASVGYLYDYRAKISPTEADIDDRVTLIDYRQLRLDSSTKRIAKRHKDIKIDLGGVAKGYAVEQGIQLLKEFGIKNAMLAAGGDMKLIGSKNGKSWTVGIQDPRNPQKFATTLPLNDVSVSTSGDYQRYFVNESGERLHHILSPRTGKPANGVQSVTVLANNSTESDGLSTAVFVLGRERGLRLINRLPGVDAIIVGSDRRLYYSEGLMAPELGNTVN